MFYQFQILPWVILSPGLAPGLGGGGLKAGGKAGEVFKGFI